MPKSIIAFCGPKGVGKSALAKLIAAKYDYTCMHFAEPIKEMIATLLRYQGLNENTIYRMLYGDLKNVPSGYLGGRTPVHCLQTLGSEWRDMVNRELWTNIWKNSASEFRYSKIIIDDLRFLHEYTAIKISGYNWGYTDIITARLEREGCKSGTHVSEQEFLIMPIDFIIDNNGPIEETLAEFESNLKLQGKFL